MLRHERARDLLIAAGLCVVCVVLYLASPAREMLDSRYSLLVSEQILRNHSTYLDRYVDQLGAPEANTCAYQTQSVAEHTYFLYPLGTSILSLPFTAAADALGASPVDPNGKYDAAAELRTQAVEAALVSALFVVLVYAIARSLLGWRASAAVALVFGLGTPVWSTASRVLWSHTWEIVLLGIVALLLVRWELRTWPMRPVLLGTLLAWAFLVRAQGLLPAVLVGLFILAVERAAALRYALSFIAWLVPFVVYSEVHFGSLLPPYYQLWGSSGLSLQGFTNGFLGLLVSPSRGLLVFVPALLPMLVLLVRYRPRLRLPYISLLATGTVLATLVVTGGWPQWWGGHSYGPRLLTDLLPWLAVLTVVGLDAYRRTRTAEGATRAWNSALQLATAGLVVVSIAIHGRGALAPETLAWNTDPVDVFAYPERVWDWRQPQFLAGVVPPSAEWQAEAARPKVVSVPPALSAIRRPERDFSLDSLLDYGRPAHGAQLTIDPSRRQTLQFSGWAVDEMLGLPAGGVFLELDNSVDIAAQYGFMRRDVADRLDNPALAQSGFAACIPMRRLNAGLHTLQFKVVTGDKTGYFVPEYTLLLSVEPSDSPPVPVQFETPAGDTVVGGQTVVSGWAANPHARPGPGVDQIQIYVDGVFRGDATYGFPRPDVAQFFQSPGMVDSGWGTTLDLSKFGGGWHTLEARARDNTTSWMASSTTVVGVARPNCVVEIPASGTRQTISGWGADTLAVGGTGLDGIAVYLDGQPLASATLGFPRPDVASYFGSDQFLNSGWGVYLDGRELHPGRHSLEVRALVSSLGRWLPCAALDWFAD